MRLLDLDPRWVLKDGKRIAFIFKSPTLGDDMWIAMGERRPPLADLWPAIAEAFPEGAFNAKGYRRAVQTMNPQQQWQIAGGLDGCSFETMTITPSIDGSPAGNWHGFITNGEIVGGI
jgi:hypothetical protein